MRSRNRQARCQGCRWLALAVVLALSGCMNRPYVVTGPDYRAERGRSAVLVFPGPRDPNMIPVARQAARLFSAELATLWFNVVDLDMVLQTSPDLEPALRQLARQAVAGEPMDRHAADALLRRHGVGQLLVMDVFSYEQYWGRQGKITRVGAEARLVSLSAGRTLWQGRYAPELSGLPGHAFDAATRRVVRELVRAMQNGVPDFRDTPFVDWPILEDLSPN